MSLEGIFYGSKCFNLGEFFNTLHDGYFVRYMVTFKDWWML